MLSTSVRERQDRKGGSFLGRVPWWLVTLLLVVAIWIGAVAAIVSIFSRSDTVLGTACDRVVEHLLTTHDPVELERSRILVNQIGCDVSRRLKRWPAVRTGNLTP